MLFLGCDSINQDCFIPKEIEEFVTQYIDRNKIFEKELKNKLDDFYNALKWDKVTADTKTAKKFFAF